MPNSNQFARQLRRNSTDAERTLWRLLRDRQLASHKFRRQAPIGPYIGRLRLLRSENHRRNDGGQHQDQLHQDQARSEWLESQGFTVLRFWNNEVMGNLDGVAHLILTALEHGISPHPNPLPNPHPNPLPSRERGQPLLKLLPRGPGFDEVVGDGDGAWNR